jgi:hypothetical protein
VNWQHLSAFFWLRWRIMRNHWRKAGAINAVLMMVAVFALCLLVIPLFAGTIWIGLFVIPRMSPTHLMYVWDGFVAGMLLFWMIGLLVELQRSESLSLSKFLHLPVSVTGAFFINYLSSLFRLSLFFFGPIMLGFSLAMIAVQGARQLPSLLLLAAFLFMLTALTYQLQGWLAALMSNPRRRRTVIVGITMAFILIFQIPNLLNLSGRGVGESFRERAAAQQREMAELNRAAGAGEIDAHTLLRRQVEVSTKYAAAAQQEGRQMQERWTQIAKVCNLVLPVGWLPLGVSSAAEGRFLSVFLGFAGMALIGSTSFWLAYRGTLAQYQGRTGRRRARPAHVEPEPVLAGERRNLLLEARPPGLSEPVAAVALGNLRTLIRSPEAKMLLIGPVIMMPIFSSILWRSNELKNNVIPELARPLIMIGFFALLILSLAQMAGNVFGFDRDGFRVFVLSPLRGRDILIGKNMSIAPIAGTFALIFLIAVQFICPLRIDHFVAMFPQFCSMFLLYCIITNTVSIFAPMHLSPGSLKASNLKITTALAHSAAFVIAFPLLESITLAPLGVEALMHTFGWGKGIPMMLILTVLELPLIVLIYAAAASGLGSAFHSREQRILEVVTSRAA